MTCNAPPPTWSLLSSWFFPVKSVVILPWNVVSQSGVTGNKSKMNWLSLCFLQGGAEWCSFGDSLLCRMNA